MASGRKTQDNQGNTRKDGKEAAVIRMIQNGFSS